MINKNIKKLIVLVLITFNITLNANNDYIEIYWAYTNGTSISLNGRIIDIKDKKSTNSSVASAFFNDERKNTNISMIVNDKEYLNKSDNEGYFIFDINISSKYNRKDNILLTLNDKEYIQKIKLFYPSLKKHIGVISDFDDTAIVSNVTNKLKLMYNTFIKNYKQREVVNEVKNKIIKIQKDNNLLNNSAVFFISGSPYQLTNTINNFLNLHNFPKRTILTKKIHGKNKDSLSATISYKYDKIVKLINMYPNVKWVLFGDSGEKDKQIYLKVLNNFPNNIKDIYIRDVVTKKVSKLKNEITPFKTDGCSYFPDGTLKNNNAWLNCCIEHDKAYWKGGTKQEKKIADEILKQCVSNQGYPNIAKLMFIGVDIGGDAKYNTSYKWGYGWKINHYYEPLSKEEQEKIKNINK